MFFFVQFDLFMDFFTFQEQMLLLMKTQEVCDGIRTCTKHKSSDMHKSRHQTAVFMDVNMVQCVWVLFFFFFKSSYIDRGAMWEEGEIF